MIDYADISAAAGLVAVALALVRLHVGRLARMERLLEEIRDSLQKDC